MKINVNATAILLVLGVIALAIFWFRSKDKLFGETFNPANPKNIINRNLNEALFPKGDASIGTKIYDSVDKIWDWLPGLDSDQEKIDRRAEERNKDRNDQPFTIRVRKSEGGSFEDDNP